mmetsp:Transcript_35091/g.41000  ORF Transcript_35091/g.41000 Transcript_35091/m.41000 type:complete len:99 (-) Transcript_35091:40-336(-)
MNSQNTMSQIIDRDPIVMCTMRGCSNSEKLRQLMQTVSSETVEVIVNTEPDAARIEKEIIERSHSLLFPQLFLKGKYVGGYLDAIALSRTGELERMIR